MRFDFGNIKDFDEHIELSIPNLPTLDEIFKQITHEYAQPESTIVDLGCSTGRFLSSLNKIDGCSYVGIDEINMEGRKKDYEFFCGDAEDYFAKYALNTHNDFSVIISMFFLQFCGAKKRQRLLTIMQNMIEQGSVLLIAEKVYLNDPHLQQSIHRLHIQEKRKAFSDKHILDKDLQLSNSMFCKTEVELQDELNALGRVLKVWQSYNFMAYVVK